MPAITTENPLPEPVIGPTSTTTLSRLRAASGYEMAVRVFGTSWFLLLALAAALRILMLAEPAAGNDFGPAEWSALLSNTCLLFFYLILCRFTLDRPSPVARTPTLLPSVTAFVGTYLPWSIALLGPETASAGQNLVSAALLLIGAISMLIVISYLGRCFSIVPQARGLVRTGPYAIVRNPLYLVEEVALLGILVQACSPLTLALFLIQGALQVRRIFYEEDLLRHTFPEYDDYAKTTPRLIPYVW